MGIGIVIAIGIAYCSSAQIPAELSNNNIS